MISIYCSTLNIWRLSWILPTMLCHTVFCGHTTVHYVGRTRKLYAKHQNHESATILKKLISIYCLTLNIRRPSCILPTMQCPKVLSGRTTMSGEPEYLMVDTKITNLLLF